MLELFQKGGPTMYALLLLSVAALAVMVERVLVLYRARTHWASARPWVATSRPKT